MTDIPAPLTAPELLRHGIRYLGDRLVQVQRERDALRADLAALAIERDGFRAHRDGLYRVMRHVAENEVSMLGQVDEMIQADVDSIIGKRRELESDLAARERRIAELEKALERIASETAATWVQDAARAALVSEFPRRMLFSCRECNAAEWVTQETGVEWPPGWARTGDGPLSCPECVARAALAADREAKT